jgi:hypothetical protein
MSVRFLRKQEIVCLVFIEFQGKYFTVHLHSQRRFIVNGFVNSCKCRHLPEQDGPLREGAIEG